MFSGIKLFSGTPARQDLRQISKNLSYILRTENCQKHWKNEFSSKLRKQVCSMPSWKFQNCNRKGVATSSFGKKFRSPANIKMKSIGLQLHRPRNNFISSFIFKTYCNPEYLSMIRPPTVSSCGLGHGIPTSTTIRHSSSSSDSKQYYSDKSKSSRQKLYYTLKHYIKSPETAEKFVSHLKEDEKRLLLAALESTHGTKEDIGDDSGKITRRQLWLVFTHNCVPFVGFGFLDNAVMILAGDAIDNTIGISLGITTMAAAALGNTVSDLAGIGLAGYVEMLFYKLGLPVPALTPEQAEQTSAILSSNLGKAFGIIVGCLLGMLPLLFLGSRSDDEEEGDS